MPVLCMKAHLHECTCAICNNGGPQIPCVGKCYRTFHANPDLYEAEEYYCETLCLIPEEMGKPFQCENCKYSIHQCFICSKLGSSDMSLNTEVFSCSASCGHFYHPNCVAKLLEKNNIAKQLDLKDKIAKGESFICPAHGCAVCKKTEDKYVFALQFVRCLRCPKSYHTQCLPSILSNDNVRSWNGIARKSAFMYCLDHEIDPELGTPARPIIFRNILNRETQQPHKKLPDDSSKHSLKNLFI